MKKTAAICLMVLFTALSVFAELDKEAFFGKEVFDAKGESAQARSLSAKVYGIYFSAHWCPPCRAFSPKLVEMYKKVNRKEKQFEVIFVSSDKNSEAQFEYMDELDMPWYTVEHKSEAANALKKKYGVSGIPMLVIVDSNGKLITKDGRDDVQSEGRNAYKKWAK